VAVVAVLLQDGFDGAAEILVFCVIRVAGVRQQRACEQAGEQESECGAVGHGGQQFSRRRCGMEADSILLLGTDHNGVFWGAVEGFCAVEPRVWSD